MSIAPGITKRAKAKEVRDPTLKANLDDFAAILQDIPEDEMDELVRACPETTQKAMTSKLGPIRKVSKNNDEYIVSCNEALCTMVKPGDVGRGIFTVFAQDDSKMIEVRRRLLLPSAAHP